MNKSISMAVVAALCVPAAGYAQSIEFAGAEVSYDYRQIEGDGFDYDSFTYQGSAEALIMGQATAQLDLFQGGYNDEVRYTGYTLHAGYMVSPGLVVGAFIGNEDWDGSDYRNVGAEVAYSSGPFTADAAYLVNSDEDGPYEATIIRIDADYEVMPGLFIVGDYSSFDSVFDNQVQNIGIGASYDLYEGVYVEANINTQSGDQESTMIGFEIGYRFDGGTTFGGRDWNSTLTGY